VSVEVSELAVADNVVADNNAPTHIDRDDARQAVDCRPADHIDKTRHRHSSVVGMSGRSDKRGKWDMSDSWAGQEHIVGLFAFPRIDCLVRTRHSRS